MVDQSPDSPTWVCGDSRPTVHISTLGCRLNQADSDALAAQAQDRGYRIVGQAAEAELHIVNSCSITHKADRDSRRTVGRLRRAAPASRIVLTGCFASTAPTDAAAVAGVDAVFRNRHEIFADRAHASAAGSVSTAEVDEAAGPARPSEVFDVPLGALRRPRADADRDLSFPPVNLTPDRSRPFLKIQDGCDYKCSFCIVPRARGPSISLDSAELVDRVRALVEAGHGELDITGVHLGTYGRDLRPRRSLRHLLEELVPHLGAARLRLGSLDPHEVDRDFIDFLADHQEKICRHLHLPLQSGDNGVLAQMRRAHTAEDLRRVCEGLVKKIPGMCIGSDIIVGFPSEDERAFAATEALLTDLPIAYLHVFSYSPRRGTAAECLGDPVAAASKKQRSQRLHRLASTQWRSFVDSQSPLPLPLLVYRQANDGRTVATKAAPSVPGLSDNYIRVKFAADRVAGRAGQWVHAPLRPIPQTTEIRQADALAVDLDRLGADG